MNPSYCQQCQSPSALPDYAPLALVIHPTIPALFALFFSGQTLTDQGADNDGPMGSSSGSAHDALLEAMSPYENYISGMLTNYKQMPVDRLHKMLTMFVISPKVHSRGNHGFNVQSTHPSTHA